ncbi:hypothetical protein BO94DRAFT_552407 [Aspergillus sclerotioniger CBS 115572]|uniref:Rhodopsin domain-containing protein n=1 Tax=Aspergillus sclerotioniger CBS 115572 TaxID=1450535 RepID=A0A317XAH5_9EURO|nr:hypothetical protein BO94DRAFT_552407 [Aspergillus sclerotioniger CBS 115572]PWY95509.1 hypothetical protein BO94DRAFT_552407 [Aspergillus sclerotioniger CBS 115572]
MAVVSPEYAHQTKGPRILAVFWTMTSLAIVLVAARLFIRIKILRSPGADDWLIAASMIFSISYSVITTVDVALGYGQHSVIITDRLELVLLVNYINFALGIISFALPKLAVAALLSRLLNPTPTQRAILWGLTGTLGHVPLVGGCNLPELMDLCRLCHFHRSCIGFYGFVSGDLPDHCPAKSSYVTPETTGSVRSLGTECGVSEILLDACAIAIVKCMQLPGLADTSDTTCGIESNVVILASCIPTLQPLLEIILGKRSLRSTGAYNYKESSTQLPASNRWGSKRSGPRRDKNDIMIADIRSQDSILQTADDHGVESHHIGRIRRTDSITVEYETVTA